MKYLMIIMGLLLIMSPAYAQVTLSGDLEEYMDSVVAAIPGSTPSGLYLQPGSASRDLWRDIVQNIMAGDYAAADSLGASIDYEVVEFSDVSVSPARTHYILQRTPASTSRYWGTFIFNPEPLRPTLAILCPHPRYDSNTGRQGFRAYHRSGALAYFVSGTHRCNGETSSSCDGTTTACSTEAAAYRYSDQAHVVLSTFQVTTEELLSVVPDLIVVQPHGFSQGTGDPDVIMSNGTRYTPDAGTETDWLVLLRDNLLAQDGSLTFKLAHIDLEWTYLIARNNCQGRLINEGSDPCGTNATGTTGRFLHLEQKYSGLRDTEANWQKLANAIIATFPPVSAFATTQSGSWTDPATWAGGVIPDSTDDVLIAAGHTISVDDTLAVCGSLNFGGDDALIDMNAKGRLSIYGDMTLFSETHNVFSGGWSSDSAYVYMVGGNDQTLSGWSTSGGSTSFRDLVIAKDSGSVVTTAGVGMRLAIQNSLHIQGGGLYLAADDDLEARWASSGNFTGNQLLEIVIDSGAIFELEDGSGTHWIRSQTGSTPIGLMTIYGEATFTDASSSDISIQNIDVKAGGQLTLSTGLGSTTYGPEFNPGTVTVDSGGAILAETTSQLWFDGSVVVLNRGGVYKTTSSTTPLPPTFVNDGRVRYQRNPSSATTDQEVVDTNYLDIEFSFNGNGTKKLWTLTDDRMVTDSVEVNNSAEVIITGTSGEVLTIDSTLRLTSGSLDVSDANVTLELADGALISRATGVMTGTPSFAGVVDARYTSSVESVTTGPELPTGITALRDLTVASPKGIVLGADVTVNGVLHCEDSLLSTDTYTATLGATATLVEDSTWVVLGRVLATRTLAQSVEETFGGIGLSITATGAAPGETVTARVTGTPQTVSGKSGIARYYEITPGTNSGLDATVIFSYAEAELNGLSESGLQVFQSMDDGANWEAIGGTVDAIANTITVAGLDSIGWLTLSESSGCCVGETGNINFDPADNVDISDLTKLVNHLFVTFELLDCRAEGNTTGDAGCDVDISDLTKLVNHLFLTFESLAPCRPECE